MPQYNDFHANTSESLAIYQLSEFNPSVQFAIPICSPEKHRRRSSFDTSCWDVAKTALLLVERLEEQSLARSIDDSVPLHRRHVSPTAGLLWWYRGGRFMVQLPESATMATMLLPPGHGSNFGTLTAPPLMAGVARLLTLRYSVSVDSTRSSMLSPTLIQCRLKVHGTACRPLATISCRLSLPRLPLPTRTKLTLRLLSDGEESDGYTSGRTIDRGMNEVGPAPVTETDRPPSANDPEPESSEVLDGCGVNIWSLSTS